jgi:hypothetical protein
MEEAPETRMIGSISMLKPKQGKKLRLGTVQCPHTIAFL